MRSPWAEPSAIARARARDGVAGHPAVMRGLDPRISLDPGFHQGRDGRVKPGHDAGHAMCDRPGLSPAMTQDMPCAIALA